MSPATPQARWSTATQRIDRGRRPVDLRARHALARPELATGRDPLARLSRVRAADAARSPLRRAAGAASPALRARSQARPQATAPAGRLRGAAPAGPRTIRPRPLSASGASCERWPASRRRRRWVARAWAGTVGGLAAGLHRGGARCATAPRPRAPSSRPSFRALRLTDRGDAEGLFTGYYEPLLKRPARPATGPVPAYGRPATS